MTSQVSNIPLSVDYTSRDFYSLREELINLVKARVNTDSSKTWTGDDPSDFGVALIEAFAYIGDITNYYIDRIANETYLPTATQRKNILNLANLYGYAPTGFRAAVLEVTFTNTNEENDYSTDITDAVGNGTTVLFTSDNALQVGDKVTITGVSPSGYNQTNVEVVSATSATFAIESTFSEEYVEGGTAVKSYRLPAGTQVSGSVICDDIVEEIIFTTLDDAYVPRAIDGSIGSETVWAQHGENVALRTENLPVGPNDIAGELLGTSNGSASQVFVLSENEVVEDSIQIFVQAGDIYEPWSQVTHLSDWGPADAVYRAEIDENNFVFIIFGDGISGAIPNNLAGIKAVYSVGGGNIGNISANIIENIDYVPGLTSVQLNALTEFVDAGNPESTGVGGADPEDNTSIRRNASRAIRAVNRAVSLEDYESIALFVDNVGKANASADVWTSVTLYVAPVRNVDDTDKFPGKNASNSAITLEWAAIQEAVKSFVQEKSQIGVSLTVAPPTYVPVTVSVVYSKNLQYTSEQAEDDIKREIVNGYSYAFQDFEQVITPEQIEARLNSLASIRTARVVLLHRNSEAAKRGALIGAASEIFVFEESSLEITESSNDARLNSLVPDSGTLSPTFDEDFYAYNVVGVTAATLTLTVTTDTGAVITVNGLSPVSDEVEIALGAVGSVTVATVLIIAPDGTSTKVYTVSIYRTSV
jgi:hypothetical protein